MLISIRSTQLGRLQCILHETEVLPERLISIVGEVEEHLVIIMDEDVVDIRVIMADRGADSLF
jgi:hypothetical protein